MGGRFRDLFGRNASKGEPEALGEDMVPSPAALAERTALSTEMSAPKTLGSTGPFSTAAPAPMRDFTG